MSENAHESESEMMVITCPQSVFWTISSVLVMKYALHGTDKVPYRWFHNRK